TGELVNTETFVHEDIVDSQGRRDAAECAPDAHSPFHKSILHALADGAVGIAVGHVVKIAANDNGVRTFVHFEPYSFGLYLSFYEPYLELTDDIAALFDGFL